MRLEITGGTAPQKIMKSSRAQKKYTMETDHYPDIIDDEEELEELLSHPSEETIDLMRKLDGDMIFLGIAGKMTLPGRWVNMPNRVWGVNGCSSLAAFSNASNEELLKHCRTIAQIIPLVGFYLQPVVGGRRLDVSFWREFARIDNVIAIKIAPFNRYQTIDVIRGVAEAGKAGEIALYTGNYLPIYGRRLPLPTRLPMPNFAGCIAGIHEVLRRQGLLEGIWTLNENETLSPGKKEEIDRVYAAYPHLNDDDFVAENLERWLK